MKYVLDTDSVYGNITPKTINKDVLDVETKKIIGKITDINKLSKNKLEIKYTLFDKNNKPWNNKSIYHRFRDNHLCCYITDKEYSKPTKGLAMSYRINPQLAKAFDTTCKFFNVKPSTMVSELIEKFVNDSEPIIRNYLMNDGGNNNGR